MQGSTHLALSDPDCVFIHPERDPKLSDHLGFLARFVPPEDVVIVKRSIGSRSHRHSSPFGSPAQNAYLSDHDPEAMRIRPKIPPYASIIKEDSENSIIGADTSAAANSVSILNPNMSGSESHDLTDTSVTVSATRPHLQSIAGPQGKKQRHKYIIALCVMLSCGSANDFFGKCIYQLLPGEDSGVNGLQNDYWASWFLTAGSFLICSFALINGRESFDKLNSNTLCRISVPAVMDLLVTGGRYVALVLLPAAVVSIMKNGLQLVFLAILRWYAGKYFSRYQWMGLLIVVVGLIIISMSDLYEADTDETSQMQSLIGVLLMTIVAFLGAIRNTLEEMLLKDLHFHSDFVVGLESIISLLVVLIAGVVIIVFYGTQWNDIPPNVTHAFSIVGIPICAVLFLIAIYGKDTMQMKVTGLSSAMTRKLFQQFYPIGTWILSLIVYYAVDTRYGEKWSVYSWFRLLGFIFVFVGTYFYMKPPKLNKRDVAEYQRQDKPALKFPHTLTLHSASMLISQQDKAQFLLQSQSGIVNDGTGTVDTAPMAYEAM